MNKKQVVIFDLDGTIIDTIDDLGVAVNYALNKNGYPSHPIEAYRLMVGNGVRKLVERALPDESQGNAGLVGKLLEDFVMYYSEHIHVHSKPYPGITELLEELQARGIKIAVATNKFQSGAESLLRHFFPNTDFSLICGDRPGHALKPDPQVIEEILSATDAGWDSVVMVGDSAVDTKVAHNAGIKSVGVAWGFRPDAVRTEADFFADSVEDLKNVLISLLAAKA